jgi:23S rRNA G2069 N7-methylase RlmK/C1962 C5-methylase RlmI
MFWFDKHDTRATFLDNRCEELYADSRQGRRSIVINPDMVACFTSLPFESNSFRLVVFDPPHLTRNGGSSWMAKKYGTLKSDWKELLTKGFKECFRVLKPEGILVFKWNETDIPVSQILKLTSEKPLFGNRCGKTAKTHWIVFLKS